MTQEDASFSPESIARQAQINTSFLHLGTVAFLRSHALSVGEYWAYLAGIADPSWRRELTAIEFARGVALNLLSFGGELRSLSGGDSRADLVFGGWPPADLLALTAISQEDADSSWSFFDHLAAARGFCFEWSRHGDEVLLTFWHVG